MKILVASKVGFIRHNLQQCLREDGHRVVTTDSQTKLLEMVGSDCQISVVIADWAQSGMSATDAIKSIRRVERMNDQGEVAAPYVIVLTTKAHKPEIDNDGPDGEGGLALAFGEVFIKPINLQLIRECIRALALAALETRPAKAEVAETLNVANSVPDTAAPGNAIHSSHQLDLSALIENAYIR